MSRIDEALKRARDGQVAGPASVALPVADADVAIAGDLERFPVENVTADLAEPELPTPAPSRARLSPASSEKRSKPAVPIQERVRHMGPKVVISAEARPEFIESCRKLAATLCEAQTSRSTQIVMIASALQSEGKTLTAANLALTLSQSYNQTVLLVDADLRRPTMHEVFRVPNEHGLSDSLGAEAGQVVRPVQLSPTLSIIPAGPAGNDPMAILSSVEMKELLQAAAAEFQWVIVDTPPIALVSDARLLGSVVDATVLVIRAGHTPWAAVQEAVDSLDRERLLGVVLNHAELKPMRSSYYHYGDRRPVRV